MESKDRILRQAATLFMRNGIKSVSMDDIAADLAMSKKTLYKTFTNKDEIVRAFVAQHLDRSQDECMSVSTPAANAVEQLLNISRWVTQEFKTIHPSIFYDLRKYYPAAWTAFVTHKNTFVLDQITQNLRWGVSEGLFRPNLDVEVLARLSLAKIELAFDPDLYPPAQFAPVRISQVFDEHFLLGIVTPRGHELISNYRRITEKARVGLPTA